MVSARRLTAVACCALGAAAAEGGIDALSMVQRDRPGGRVTGRGTVTFASKHGSMLYHIFANGHRLSKLLWGNATQAPEAIPVISTTAPGCTEGDRESAMAAAQKLHERMHSQVQAMMDKMMQGGLPMGMGDGLQFPMVPFTDTAVPEASISESLDLPKACASLESGEDLSWSAIAACTQDAFHVSGGCLQCLPDFAQRLRAECKGTCNSGLDTIAEKLAGSLDEMNGKMEKSASRSWGGMPSHADMQDAARGLSSALNEAAKQFLPCQQCMSPRMTSFAGCLGGDEAARLMEQSSKDLEKGLRSGDLLGVDVGGEDRESGDLGGARQGVMM